MAYSIQLKKGENTKINSSLTKLSVGLGWDPDDTGSEFDLDAVAFLVDKNDKFDKRDARNFIFYNFKQSIDGAVTHNGDSRTGVGDGDDEVIDIDLKKLSPSIMKIILAVSIHDAVERRQNFGQVPNAFIRLVDPVSNNELCRYDLREDFSGATVVIFGEIYKHQTDWKFRAVGKAFNGDLGALVNIFA